MYLSIRRQNSQVRLPRLLSVGQSLMVACTLGRQLEIVHEVVQILVWLFYFVGITAERSLRLPAVDVEPLGRLLLLLLKLAELQAALRVVLLHDSLSGCFDRSFLHPHDSHLLII